MSPRLWRPFPQSFRIPLRRWWCTTLPSRRAPGCWTCVPLRAARGWGSPTLRATSSPATFHLPGCVWCRRTSSGWEGGVQVGLVVADARTLPFRPADVVLLDVPCTGTGTFRRHPDGRWRVTEADLVALAELQRELLEGAAVAVRPGGVLVYSTCSLEPEENEVQVQSFLDRHPGFSPDPPSGDVAAELRDERGWLRVLPQQTEVDGAFAARLRRVA